MHEAPAFDLLFYLPKFRPCRFFRGPRLHGLAVSLPVLVIAIYDIPSASFCDASHKLTILSENKMPEDFSRSMSEPPAASPLRESSGIV